MPAPTADVFRYVFPAPFPIRLSSGVTCLTVTPNIQFEFERDASGDPHWYLAYEIVGGQRGQSLFRAAFEDTGSGPVPTV